MIVGKDKLQELHTGDLDGFWEGIDKLLWKNTGLNSDIDLEPGLDLFRAQLEISSTKEQFSNEPVPQCGAEEGPSIVSKPLRENGMDSDTHSQGTDSQGTDSQGTDSQGIDNHGAESPAIESPAAESHALESPAVGQEIKSLKYKYVLGKFVGRDITDSRGSLIARRNDPITREIVDSAEKEGKLAELIVHMTIPGLDESHDT